MNSVKSKGKKIVKQRKPKDLCLGDQNHHVVACGNGHRHAFFYIKPDSQTYLWVDKRKAKQLHEWLGRVIEFQERKP